MFKTYGIIIGMLVFVFTLAYCQEKSYEPCCADSIIQDPVAPRTLNGE